MALSDYSNIPGNNADISGINVDENCNPANINDAIRQMMADLAVHYDLFVDAKDNADNAARVDAGNTFALPQIFNDAIRVLGRINARVPANEQLRLGGDTGAINTDTGLPADSLKPFLSWYDGDVTRRAFIQANTDELLMQFDGGASISITDTAGAVEISGSRAITAENAAVQLASEFVLQSSRFVSADQTLTASNIMSIAHGLTGTVQGASVELRCISDDAEYEIGDRILSGIRGVMATVNVGTANVRLHTGPTVEIISEFTKAYTAIDLTKWVAVVRAYV